MLSQPKSAVYNQVAKLFTKAKATPHRELVTSIQPLKLLDYLLDKKLTGSQFHKIALLTLQANFSLYPICRKKQIYFNGQPPETQIQKPPAMLHLSVRIKNISIYLVTLSL
jgi:hypothetical protein